jgi:hypothetical protein
MLAKHSDVSVRTIKTIESSDANQTVKEATIQKLKSALEAAGIEFIGTPTDRPGIRIGPPKTDSSAT